ncbi:hypothetical protein LOTGIDRAFT_209828 [Lottia gigantea]|uniref:BSD domain-containing protein n=1 Tax=Lottia gigantea TaxID=225164 RepID=V3ZX33_LOTGI|nr:hypothetical protein LOTGIDRAFT_209828 [Lottia gigantea]ESO88922.1 hypothetical protein LOTGIDRAFT_209828 [Lottia gigantea]
MFSSVTSWLGVGEKSEELKPQVKGENKENDGNDKENIKSEKIENVNKKSDSDAVDGDKSESAKNEQKAEVEGENHSEPSNQQILEDVSAKALNTAKEWGSYLYSFGKIAGKTVADTAKQFKTTVEEKTILGDFSKEHEKFLAEKKEEKRHQEAAVPPWVGYNEEETMRQQILALSQDKRNFLRNPPSGVQFQFDFQAMYPIAMATLQEDLNLKEKRFDLVPKQVSEEVFWRNYFYRVSLIKQSTQLTSMAQQTGTTGESRSSSSSRRSSAGSENKADVKPIPNNETEDVSHQPESPNENEFISDAFSDNNMDEEALKKEMELLGVKEDDAWEKELQQELQEYEVVDESGADMEDDLEQEILKQIEQEANMIS